MSQYQYDVFLSHNSADKLLVRSVAENLKASGLNIWFDEWVIDVGDIIYLSIESGLDASRCLALFISASGLKSDWVGLERSSAIFRDPTNRERRFIPILVDDCDMPSSLQQYRYLDFRQSADRETALSQLIKIIHERTGKIPSQASGFNAQQANARPIHDVLTFHYLSTRRILNLFDQLPDEAFSEEILPSVRWANAARLDTLGDQGSHEERLRAYQRQLSVILNYWKHSSPPPPLAELIKSVGTPDSNRFYAAVANFQVESGATNDRAIWLVAQYGDYTLRIEASKENFPGLSPTVTPGIYEPNSLMPGFFLGDQSLRLLAYIQCNSIDHQARTIVAHALCLVSSLSERSSENVP